MMHASMMKVSDVGAVVVGKKTNKATFIKLRVKERSII